MVRRLLQVLILSLMVFAFAACKRTAAPVVTLPFESPVQPFDSPLQPDVSVQAVVPSPVPGFGVVTGQILDRATGQAPLEGVVYLGSVLTMDNQKPVVRLVKSKDPFAMPDAGGHFSFPQVAPGEYGVVFATPEESFLIDDPGTGESITLSVGAGQVVDLGTIRLSMP